MAMEKQLETPKLQALGMIETCGLIASIEAVDAMLEATDAGLVGSKRTGAGLVTITVQGDMGAVKAITGAGTEAASRMGEYVPAHVIPRPHGSIGVVLPQAKQGGGQ